jgi:hypothetical protein
MGKAPDLNIIDLHTLFCQFGDKPPQGEVALGPIQKPGPQIAGQQARLVAPHPVRSHAACLPVAANPLDRAAHRYAKSRRRRTSRNPLTLYRSYKPLAQIRRYGSDHAMLASNPSNHLESEKSTKGNPL